ncbi:MAG: C-terminal binding protein [Gaiellales bacterium]
MKRVIILDPLWPLEESADVLATLDVTLEKASTVSGDDVVAVLAAPEQRVPADLLDHAPNVRLVGTCSTGYDNLPVPELQARGVTCIHVAGYCDDEVAEHTITLASALLRGVHQLDRFTRDGGWWPFPREPRRIRGSRLGIIGFGRIGRLVATQGAALGMEIVAFDEFVAEDVMRELGVEKVDIDTLFETSDVVTLHAPLLPETRNLINARRLAQMRDDAYLINCARGPLVDHAALGDALVHGVIAGAAIDVYPVEPPPADEPAFGWPNLIVQPHSAWYSPAASLAPYTRQIDDLARFLRGETPVGVIPGGP